MLGSCSDTSSIVDREDGGSNSRGGLAGCQLLLDAVCRHHSVLFSDNMQLFPRDLAAVVDEYRCRLVSTCLRVVGTRLKACTLVSTHVTSTQVTSTHVTSTQPLPIPFCRSASDQLPKTLDGMQEQLRLQSALSRSGGLHFAGASTAMGTDDVAAAGGALAEIHRSTRQLTDVFQQVGGEGRGGN